jgi:hypothetical protein
MHSLPAPRLLADSPEGEELRVHVRGCGLCRVAFDSRRCEDRQFEEALSATPVPDGLEARLHAALDQASRSSRRRSWIRGSWRRWSAVAACAVVAGAGWFAWPRSALSLVQVREIVNQSVIAPADGLSRLEGWAVATNAPAAPRDWRRLILDATPKGLDVDGRTGLDVAIYRFADAASRVRGLIVAIPRQLLSDPPKSSMPLDIQYLPLPSSAWCEGDQVYVCVAQEGDLAILLRSLYGATA